MRWHFQTHPGEPFSKWAVLVQNLADGETGLKNFPLTLPIRIKELFFNEFLLFCSYFLVIHLFVFSFKNSQLVSFVAFSSPFFLCLNLSFEHLAFQKRVRFLALPRGGVSARLARGLMCSVIKDLQQQEETVPLLVNV